MKRLWPLLIVLLFSLTACGTNKSNNNSTSQSSQQQEETVYITRTGEKYHRDSCRYLKKSKKSIKLSKAVDNGYTPCKVCKP